MHKVRAYERKSSEITKSLKYLTFFMGLIDIRVSEDLIGSLLDDSLLIEDIFGKEEDKVGEQNYFER